MSSRPLSRPGPVIWVAVRLGQSAFTRMFWGGGGRRYENTYVVILRFRDGKIAVWKEYFDYVRGSGGLDRLVKSAMKRQERPA